MVTLYLFMIYLSELEKYSNTKERLMFEHISKGDIDNVLDFLNDVDVNRSYVGGNTLLNCSVEYDNYLVTKKLLEKGANPNMLTDNWCCPIVYSIKRKDIKLTNLLRQYGAGLSIMIFFLDDIFEYPDHKIILEFLSGCKIEQLKQISKDFDIQSFLDENVSLSKKIGCDDVWQEIYKYI